MGDEALTEHSVCCLMIDQLKEYLMFLCSVRDRSSAESYGLLQILFKGLRGVWKWQSEITFLLV